MKRLQQALVAAPFIALPVASHAADNTSLTRDALPLAMTGHTRTGR